MATMLQAQKANDEAITKEASAIENESQIYKNLGIVKEAKEITIPMDGANVSDKDTKKVQIWSKANLPEDTAEGDIINIGGRSYKVSSNPDAFGKEDAGGWCLTMIESK